MAIYRVQRLFSGLISTDPYFRTNNVKKYEGLSEGQLQEYKNLRHQEAEKLWDRRRSANQVFQSNLQGNNPEIERGVTEAVQSNRNVKQATKAAQREVNLANPMAEKGSREALVLSGQGKTLGRVQKAQNAINSRNNIISSVGNSQRRALALQARNEAFAAGSASAQNNLQAGLSRIKSNKGIGKFIKKFVR